MPINQYGLNVTDEQNPLGTTSTVAPTGQQSNQNAAQGQQSAFGPVTPGSITAAGAAPVAPPVTNFAFNEKYAAQNAGLEQLLADRQRERQNQMFAAEESYGRNVSDAGRTRDKALESLINKYASSGIIGSGIDARSRGDLETDYQRYLGDLSIALGNTKQGIEGNWANTIRDVNNQRTGMWTRQLEEEQAARDLAEQRRLAAEQAQREAENQRRIAEEYRAAQEAAARQPPPVINMGMPSAGGVVGGGGGGGGGGAGSSPAAGMNAPEFGIGPGDTYQDIVNQIKLLGGQGDIHMLSLLYSSPYFQTPQMAQMKKDLGGYIYNASTPGAPGYIPSRPEDASAPYFW